MAAQLSEIVIKDLTARIDIEGSYDVFREMCRDIYPAVEKLVLSLHKTAPAPTATGHPVPVAAAAAAASKPTSNWNNFLKARNAELHAERGKGGNFRTEISAEWKQMSAEQKQAWKTPGGAATTVAAAAPVPGVSIAAPAAKAKTTRAQSGWQKFMSAYGKLLKASAVPNDERLKQTGAAWKLLSEAEKEIWKHNDVGPFPADGNEAPEEPTAVPEEPTEEVETADVEEVPEEPVDDVPEEPADDETE
jgi:hypothetical protein